MAGETIKTEAICLRIVPWSRTSHIVTWLTPHGKITSVVKGAVRAKSAFLGQYDLNYTCEILYYARAYGELHALRECVPLVFRENLRTDFRALLLAEYVRAQIRDVASAGPDASAWYQLLSSTLDTLATREGRDYLRLLLSFECSLLRLAGLAPELEADDGAFHLRGERKFPVPADVAKCLHNPSREKNRETLHRALRAIGIFYSFHLDAPSEPRRELLRLLSPSTREWE